MKPIQHNERSTAAQDFQQSLDQLKDIIQENYPEATVTSPLHSSNNRNTAISENTEKIDLAAWEDAVADIENYLEQKAKKS